MASTLAVVFCVHHKPWLMMSTLITVLAQDHQGADFYFLYNVGQGNRFHADATAINGQLSPFDERVREVCRLNRTRLFELEYENDEALDSGAWYKFIKDGHWKAYDWVLFVGEGTLFARPALVSSMLAFAASDPNVQVIASGHEKRRIPKDQFLRYMERESNPSDIDRLHDEMIGKTFDVFRRDPEFQTVFDAWSSDFAPETQYHVPDAGPPSAWLRRVESAWVRRVGSPFGGNALQQLPWTVESMVARSQMTRSAAPGKTNGAHIYVNGERRPVESVVNVTRVNGVGFHRVDEPEWFGCATNHLMSRRFLERFTEKLEKFEMYDLLRLRFAGTALEVIWGLIPAWLGFEKWFTDGFHRVRKDFVTYRREDYPPEMATYINRYHRGSLSVGWSGDFLKLRAWRPELEHLHRELPALYF